MENVNKNPLTKGEGSFAEFQLVVWMVGPGQWESVSGREHLSPGEGEVVAVPAAAESSPCCCPVCATHGGTESQNH